MRKTLSDFNFDSVSRDKQASFGSKEEDAILKKKKGKTRALRTPRHYDGIQRTHRKMDEILPAVMESVHGHIRNRSALVLAAWPGVIGSQLASMTQAVRFVEGILTVKVNNSTLYSLLKRHDKPKLLQKFKKQFPNVSIHDIVFRIG